jgi:hypothetical protein
LKNRKYWKRRFGSDAAEKISGYIHHLDLRRIDDLEDEGLDYLLSKVKGINMLDLNETEISNASIKRLTELEYIKELNLKGCRIDDECISDLNKITGLESLHLKDTFITIDGLLQLNTLNNLKVLMFSAEDVELIKEKTAQLRILFPDCNFVINSKPFS